MDQTARFNEAESTLVNECETVQMFAENAWSGCDKKS